MSSDEELPPPVVLDAAPSPPPKAVPSPCVDGPALNMVHVPAPKPITMRIMVVDANGANTGVLAKYSCWRKKFDFCKFASVEAAHQACDIWLQGMAEKHSSSSAAAPVQKKPLKRSSSSAAANSGATASSGAAAIPGAAADPSLAPARKSAKWTRPPKTDEQLARETFMVAEFMLTSSVRPLAGEKWTLYVKRRVPQLPTQLKVVHLKICSAEFKKRPMALLKQPDGPAEVVASTD